MVLDRIQLIKQLSRHDACKPALMSARNMSVDELLKLYIKNIDYGIRSGLLTPEFIKDNASLGQLQHAGIYIDHSCSVLNPGALVLLGSCLIKTLNSGYDVARVYASQSTKLTADVTGNANVVIEAYGNSFIEVHQYESAHVLVILNDQSECVHYGKVTIKRK